MADGDRIALWHKTGSGPVVNALPGEWRGYTCTVRLLAAFLMLVSLAILSCGGSGLTQPDSATMGLRDATPKVDAGAVDTPLCVLADKLICLTNCTDRFPDWEASCQDGLWFCPSGSKDSKTCPADACAVTPGYCCDPLTGDLTENPCPTGAELRPSCPEGRKRSYNLPCIPQGLGIYDCSDLDRQPCSGQEHYCSSMSRMGEAWCRCLAFTDPDAGEAVWRCGYIIP
jgi:hypothetical protein